MVEPIAIIGSSCRLPGGANSPSKLWDILTEPGDYLRKIDRFNIDAFYNEDGAHHGHTNVKHAYLLDDDIKAFDPQFFGIRPVEANSIDPLQRLLLETVYEGLEHAGLTLEGLDGSQTGFFCGVMQSDWAGMMVGDLETIPQYFPTASSRSILANRVSYVFNWHGPSFVIDTACSSSAVALHSAVQSLRAKDSDVAVAAGANLILTPEMFVGLSKMNLLSNKGRSAIWDKNGNGYGRGEGVVSVVLKRLSDAINDGDHIECLIRDIGHNQDGRTQGITMPSGKAQAALIRKTYANAGLNPLNPSDRPQFFEAHGTGTKVGDPQEASAIYHSFFGPDVLAHSHSALPLWVGGVKTVLGHSEGTAGLTGLLKASLSVQNGVIPPNLLFEELNPEIERFYGPLEIPLRPTAWPPLPAGAPRRASVNSFGFGGANVHMIVENFTPERKAATEGRDQAATLLPFLFSAQSEASLARYLSSFKTYLASSADLDLSDLAWTLAHRRSAFSVKTSFPASSRVELIQNIEQLLAKLDTEPSPKCGTRPTNRGNKILGVFTGQGAQWPSMAAELIATIPTARTTVESLNSALQSLPEDLRPSWDIAEELRRDSKTSNIHQASFSQTLCTAVQIILVDMVRTCGITFSAVIGHSSGEIGAAYAAGFISSTDAVKIAYLRGKFAPLARGSNGAKGAMLAVTASVDDAKQLCETPELRGRIALAAVNSTSSVTLAGDDVAIERAHAILDERKVFARRLKVDTAYHSHHMEPCARLYLESLCAAHIKVQEPRQDVVWYSSVDHGERVDATEALSGEYWKDNMVNTVDFLAASAKAVNEAGPFQLALEIGPHPALKGPATQTFVELGAEVPYFGLLSRNNSDIRSLSAAIGAVWTSLAGTKLDFPEIYRLVRPNGTPTVVKGLPGYSWDHDKPYWDKSRRSRILHERAEAGRALLGVRDDDDDKVQYRWRNLLDLREYRWLAQHKMQGQIILPATMYVSMALEAAGIVCGQGLGKFAEIEDLTVNSPVVFDDEESRVEMVTTLSSVSVLENVMTADVAVSAHLSKEASGLINVASAKVKVFFSDDAQNTRLPIPTATPSHLVPVDVESFYESLEIAGYGYNGSFRNLTDLQRRLHYAAGLLITTGFEIATGDAPLLVHPALLEHSFQTLLGGAFAPGDGKLWSLYLPMGIEKITIDLAELRRSSDRPFTCEAWVSTMDSRRIIGDVIFSARDSIGERTLLQVEGASLQTIVPPTSDHDTKMFAESVWDVAVPNDEGSIERSSGTDRVLAQVVERIGVYYWRALLDTISATEWERCSDTHKRLRSAVDHYLARNMASGYIQREWKTDDETTIQRLISDHAAASVDVRLASAVGRALPSVVRGESTMIEHMRVDNMLDDFYVEGLGFAETSRALARSIKQLTHRYPNMEILEIGAGTGVAARAIFDHIEGKYRSYTYTDISSGFFEAAADKFSDQSNKMLFKTLDIERLPSDQNYASRYDLIVASNVLHATTSLENTLKNVRSLLRPGGYLALLEITDNSSIRFSFLMGGLSGWWLGANDGRPYSACIDPLKWEQVLRATGFGGIDRITLSQDTHANPMSVMIAQAVDDQIQTLRRPLSRQTGSFGQLHVLGGASLKTWKLVRDMTAEIGSCFEDIIVLRTLEEASTHGIPPGAIVLSFLNFDGPIWKDLDHDRFAALQHIVSRSKTLLWVTHNQTTDPWTNASSGFLRSLAAEHVDMRLQTLDFDGLDDPTKHIRTICEVLVRFLEERELALGSNLERRLLWTTEPELRFKAGNLLVKRVKWHGTYNNRYNSSRRSIESQESQGAAIRLLKADETWVLKDDYLPQTLPSNADQEYVDIAVEMSTVWTFKTDNIQPEAHVSIGRLANSGQLVILTSPELLSTIKARSQELYPIPETVQNHAEFLTILLLEFSRARVEQFLQQDSGTVLVHEPSPLLLDVYKGLAKVKFVSKNASRRGDDWIQIHTRASAKATRRAIPKDTGLFQHFQSDVTQVANILASLPASAKVLEESRALRRENARDGSPLGAPGHDLAVTIERALTRLQANEDLGSYKVDLVTPSGLQQEKSSELPLTALLDWRNEGHSPVQVSPVRSEKVFRRDRTYIAIGMTGETGRSICRWMIECGAGTVVLSSRNPKVDQAWIDEVQLGGAKVKVACLDATSKASWENFVADVTAELPPVAGVLNGAMVLRDKYFHNMELDDFTAATDAKIKGTILMDEFFRDASLDFFIVFSSFSSQIGSRGQTNYNAGNAFVTALVHQRRARGLAASVIHLGSLVGLGLLTRDLTMRKLVIDKFGYTPVAESDLHAILAQAIMSGLPNSDENPEIITGLRETIEGEDRGVHWATNPMFSHLVVPAEQENKSDDERKSVVPARIQLSAAVTRKQACQILTTCFKVKLSAMLQIPEASFQEEVALIGLGVDSMVAIDIRAWFLKEINTNITVLKILGGLSTAGLAEYAIEQIKDGMLPGLTANTDPGTGSKPRPQLVAATIRGPNESKQDSRGSSGPPSETSPIFTPLLSSAASATTSVDDPLLEPPQEVNLPSYAIDAPVANVSDCRSALDSLPPPILHRTRISPAQSRFWFLNMLLDDPTCSNISLQFEIQGRINVAAFNKAVIDTAQAHDVLRSCFIQDEDDQQRAWLGLMETTKISFSHQPSASQSDIKAAYHQVRTHHYDLAQGKTMQCRLLSKSPTEHVVIFGYHHIVLDGMGFEAFKHDLERVYQGELPLPRGHTFFQASELQHESLKDGSLHSKLAYWKAECLGAPGLLGLLPVSKVSSRKEMASYSSAYVEQRLPQDLVEKVKTVCRQFAATPSHFYLAVFHILLMRLNQVTDICIGIADANRHDSNVEATVGLFLNMLPLRFQNQHGASFRDVVVDTRTKVLEGLENAGVPFDELLKYLDIQRSSSYSPVFQSFFDFHSGTQETCSFDNQTWKISNRQPGERAYDITMDILDGKGGTLVSLIGQDYLYGEHELRQVLKCYVSLVEQFAQSPTIATNAAPMYDQIQVQHAIQLGKGSRTSFGWPSTLAHRVQSICKENGTTIALRCEARQLTYDDLHAKASTICHELLLAGVEAGNRVVVYQEPGTDWICSMLGIFYSGAVYVPLVCSNPLPRLNAILDLADPKAILVNSTTKKRAVDLKTEAKILDVNATSPKTVPPPNLTVSSESPAVILFTSGSTGYPKGVELRHQNLVNHIEGYVKQWTLGREVVLQQSAYSFDLSLGQIFSALTMGGTLVIASQAQRGDPVALARLIRSEQVTWTLQTPSEYAALLNFGADDLRASSSWVHALACGECLTKDLIRNFARLGSVQLRLYNCYGPVEATIFATMTEVDYTTFDYSSPVPIGKPNANYSIYVVDDEGSVVPPSFFGEILIGGCGVGTQYVHLPDLTKQKFLQNKYSSKEEASHGWNTVYRTGDMGRFSADGNLIYGGRREGDTQIKIRGFRVELQDIESTLIRTSEGSIAEAIVTLKDDSQLLVAHVLFSDAQKPENVPAYLARLLADLPVPNYMRPARAVAVEVLPRNVHGKIDRGAIRKLELFQTEDTSTDDVVLTPIQQEIARIWTETLPNELVEGRTLACSTDFFQLGGNSLLLVTIQARIRAVLDVSIRLLDLLNVSTLGQRAALAEASRVVVDVDWERETSLDESLCRMTRELPLDRPLRTTDRTVLLTGATGFLGRYLLDSLARDPTVKSIHCLAVRARSSALAAERLPQDKKIFVHHGDLSSPRLGLTPETFERLSDEVDMIIHSGARRSFWDNYAELKDTNVSSTKELVRLALRRGAPIQFLSSRGVLLLDEQIDPSREASVAAFRPPVQGSDGYIASKWASEVYLENAGRALGIPIVIHRFTERAGRGSDEDRQKALRDVLAPTLVLKQLPEGGSWEGRLDGIHCETLATRIAQARGDGVLTFVHHPGQFYLTPRELFAYLDMQLGDQITERVNFLPWVGAIKRAGYNWLFTAHDLTLTETRDGRTTTLHEKR